MPMAFHFQGWNMISFDKSKIYIGVRDEDKDAFYAKIPYDMLNKVHKVGGKWMQSGKEWRFPLDDEIWAKFQEVFKSEFDANKVEMDLKFISAMSKRQQRLDEFLKAKEVAMEDAPTDFGVKGVALDGKNCLFNYQRWGVKCGLSVGDGFLIGDVPGLGKSIQALAIAIERKNRGEITNCLIVCPASLKYNWLDEIHKFTKETALVIGHKCKTPQERMQHWIADGYFFKITNYEMLARDLYAEPNKKDNRIPCAAQVLKSFEMVVFDEIHYCKHHSSIRTLACRSLQAKYRVGLTGTPIDGRLEEIHSIFQILKPGLFVSKQKFLERYAEFDWFGGIKGYHHVQEVSDKIAPYYLRRVKEKVLKDLPPKIYKDMHVIMSDKNMKAYKDIIKGKSAITEDKQATEMIMRARQFLDFPEIVNMHNNSDKYAVFKELLDELVKENNQKVLVFSGYTNTIKWLVKNLEEDYKGQIEVIDGSVPDERRQEICKDFNTNDKIRILIGSDAMSTGLNLQAAESVIHYTDSFQPSIMQQRNDRAHRANSTHSVTIYRFITDGTIEEHIRDVLAKKMVVTNALLNENCNEFEFSELTPIELLSCL